MGKVTKRITIEMKGERFPIELDVTPHRHEDEEFEIYKERQKFNRQFLKMEVKENLFDSLGYIDKMVGQKGRTAVKDKNGNLIEFKKDKNGSNTNTNGDVTDEGSTTDATRSDRSASL